MMDKNRQMTPRSQNWSTSSALTAPPRTHPTSLASFTNPTSFHRTARAGLLGPSTPAPFSARQPRAQSSNVASWAPCDVETKHGIHTSQQIALPVRMLPHFYSKAPLTSARSRRRAAHRSRPSNPHRHGCSSNPSVCSVNWTGPRGRRYTPAGPNARPRWGGAR